MIELARQSPPGPTIRVAVYTRFPLDMDSPHGGVESVAAALVPALARRSGLEIEVVTLERDRSEAMIEQHKGFRVHRLAGTHWPQVADVMLGPGRARLVRYFHELNADVVHSHETYGLNLGELDIPHVFTVHGFDTENIPASHGRWAGLRSRLWRRVERHGLAGQHDVISISPYVREMIEPLTDATIHDVENPVDERFYALPREPAEPPRVLCVGWLDERKNSLGALEMFLHAVSLGAPGRLVFAGRAPDDDYERRLRKRISSAGMEDRVELLGQLSRRELMRELSRASILLLPSRQENAPMAVAEAMAAGLAVMASNRCGMPYMVADGRSGFLIEPDDTADGGRKLAKLLDDPIRADEMGCESRRIARRFRPDAIAEKTEFIYRRLAAVGRAAST